MCSSRALNGVLVLAAFGAGCVGAQPAVRVNQSGYSVGFKQGYADGCESAGLRSQRRDRSRYMTEADYMTGWNDGNNACGGR